MRSASRVPRLMWIPPPLLFVIAFVAGMGVQRIAPRLVQSPSAVRIGQLVGIGLLACGLLVLMACVAMFLKARTTLVPAGTASSLQTRGPYRFTRNPIYLSMVLMYLGGAGILAQPWALLLLPVPVLILNAVVIPFEETRLRAVFGDDFRAYSARVRRWV